MWPSGSDEREPLAEFLCDHLGMHVIEETDTFTLVGIDAKLGKLTLFDAEGPRQRGALERVVLRVSDLDSVARVAAVRGRAAGDGVAAFEAPAGLPLGLVRERGARLRPRPRRARRSRTPRPPSSCFEELGFERRADGTRRAWTTDTCAWRAAAPPTAGARS